MSDLIQEVIKKYSSPKTNTNIEDIDRIIEDHSYSNYGATIEKKAIDQFKLLKLQAQYPMIDLSFLSMKNQDGDPAFSIFKVWQGLTSRHICELVAFAQTSNYDNIYSNLNIPNIKIKQAYRLHEQKLKREAWDIFKEKNSLWKTIKNLKVNKIIIKLQTQFIGLIPNNIWKEIDSFTGTKDRIYLVCETIKWSKGECPIPSSTIPCEAMIIGELFDHFFIISQFNPISVKNYQDIETY